MDDYSRVTTMREQLKKFLRISKLNQIYQGDTKMVVGEGNISDCCVYNGK